MVMIHTVAWCFKLSHNSFHAVSRCFTVLFSAISRCFIALFRSVSICVTALFHDASRCFKVIHCPLSSRLMTMKQVQCKLACILLKGCTRDGFEYNAFDVRQLTKFWNSCRLKADIWYICLRELPGKTSRTLRRTFVRTCTIVCVDSVRSQCATSL